MLKRKSYNYLLKWKESHKNECLLVKGARQVGKTYLIEKFGEEEYESLIEINFYREPECREIFEGPLSSEEILKMISIYKPGSKIIPGRTLLFLDEIQKCARARTALKFLAEDKRVDVIASGSLLGLHYGFDADKDVEEVESIPVGYESQHTMYSLDFEEFLWAYGYGEDSISYLLTYFEEGKKVPDELNARMEQLFREYIVVGGMPEAVAEFIREKNFQDAKRVQEKILATYDDDITQHAPNVEKPKIRRCYDSLPSQLSRENKRFSYAKVEKGTGAKKYGDSLTWLKDANLVMACSDVFEPYIPLVGNADESVFKLYINDTGLLMARYGDETKKAVLNNSIKGNAKGGIYENIIAEQLMKKGYSLHYFKNRNNTQEIEFIIERDGEVIPIEVKAGNTSSVSLNSFMQEYKPSVAYKLINGNVGVLGTKRSLPHYMILFI